MHILHSVILISGIWSCITLNATVHCILLYSDVLYWLVLVENTVDETTPPNPKSTCIYISSVKQVQISPSQLIVSAVTWFSDASVFPVSSQFLLRTWRLEWQLYFHSLYSILFPVHITSQCVPLWDITGSLFLKWKVWLMIDCPLITQSVCQSQWAGDISSILLLYWLSSLQRISASMENFLNKDI